MRVIGITLLVGLSCLAAVIAIRFGSAGAARTVASTQPTTAPSNAIRVGLVPERDIFAQRRRYRVLADYLSAKLNCPVELVSLNTYDAILQEFARDEVDVAFLGSLVAVLTMDRQGAEVIAKPQLEGGASTYRGVIFVPEESPIRSIADLAGHSIAMLRTTTAGDLYPIVAMRNAGLLDRPGAPRLIWAGTHDDCINSVIDGHADAAAVKDLVLEEYQRNNPQRKLRWLGVSEPVPNNALLVRKDLAQSLGPQLRRVLLEMERDPAGKAALAAFGARRFLPCSIGEYGAIYDLVEQVGAGWSEVGVQGPAPRRPPQLQPR